MSSRLSARRPLVRSLPALLLVGLGLGLGCLEPGDTPLGAESGIAPVPEEARRFVLSGDALGLRVTRLEESRPLFATEALYCGFDAASGFRAEPVFRFDCSKLEPFVAGIETARLLPDFLGTNTEKPWLDDNPDIDREVFVRVWRLPDRDFEDEVLTGIAAVAGAWPLSESPVQLVSGSEGLPLPADSVEAWVAAGLTVNLALGLEDALSEPGLLRLTSMRSDSTAAVLRIDPVSSAETTQSTETVLDGLLADKQDQGAEFADRLLLATGVTRDAHLIFDLPDSLRDPSFVLVRAILELAPDVEGLVGEGPYDRRDNDFGGLFLDEGGLTLALRAVDDSLPGSAGLDTGTLLEARLSVFEEFITFDEVDTDLQLTATRLTQPFRLPLTTWLQDWMNGTDENAGITLRLNGEGERLRQLTWYLAASASHDSLQPRLELIYLRRPDFD